MQDVQDPNDPNDNLNYVYLYDANGNVGQLVDWAHDPNDPNGAIVAQYEYDPYANVTAKSGSYADENPFRFSTKYFDVETGLSYFGGRYYNAGLGRWLNRDPLDELGAVNLYAYAGNDPIDRIDPLGQMWCGREQGCYLAGGHNEGNTNCPRKPAPERKPPCSDCAQTCSSAAGQAALKGDLGGVICRPDGCRCACVDTSRFSGGPPGTPEAIGQQCAYKHEEKHVDQGTGQTAMHPWCFQCSGGGASGLGRQGKKLLCSNSNADECMAYETELKCLADALRNGQCSNNYCVRVIQITLYTLASQTCGEIGCRVNALEYGGVLPRSFLEQLRQDCAARSRRSHR